MQRKYLYDIRYKLYIGLNGSLLCRKHDRRRLAALSRSCFSSISSVESGVSLLLQPHQSFSKTFKSTGVAYFRSFDHLILITFDVIVIAVGFSYLGDVFVIAHQERRPEARATALGAKDRDGAQP
ncbi:hypothetical protein AVEN_272980-1 [Araneus ventricosus]|uniref:Uncharacterized protein n=1 Tax=Araneus ventricosus TaxID=182803 RepID=A0A4Y2IEQ8_ARAVE|nr:hypothetical protein AVEN_272980-1 [Araneus ventricosus]